MKYSNESVFRAASGLLIAMTIACASGSRKPSPDAVALIEDYFLRRTELDSIEGIWLREDRLCEIAVFMSPSSMSQDYAYVGVVTNDCYHGELVDTRFDMRERSDVSVASSQLLSIKAVEPDGRFYPAWHQHPNGSRYQCELYIAQGNLYVSWPSRTWGFERVYPAEER